MVQIQKKYLFILDLRIQIDEAATQRNSNPNSDSFSNFKHENVNAGSRVDNNAAMKVFY